MSNDFRRGMACPICAKAATTSVFSRAFVPLYNLKRHLSRACALNAHTGNVEFRYCPACQFLFNAAFDADLMSYQVDYDSSRASSRYFNQYLAGVATEVNRAFAVEGKTVVEVGSGDGQFLRMLHEKFGAEAIGFEPNVGPTANYGSVPIVRGYYEPSGIKRVPYLIVLRHIMEHQGDPHAFLGSILTANSAYRPYHVYIEVPDAGWVVRNDQLYAFSYEHCSYYSATAMQRLLAGYGYSVTTRYTFEDEYLQVFASRDGNHSKAGPGEKTATDRAVEGFCERMPEVFDRLAGYFAGDCSRTVLWGAGGKGTMLLNVLGLDYRRLPYVVDSNPNRHGTYIPVMGQKVVAPADLKRIKPRRVLLTNPSYTTEIRATLDQVGVESEVVVVA